MLDPLILSDRILHGIDPGLLDDEQRLRFARALIEHGRADDARTRLLLQAFVLLEEEDRAILRQVIRRRLRVLPPPSGVMDGLVQNGGA